MSTEHDYIDDALRIGAMFDIITPVKSIIETALTDRRHYGVPVENIAHVDAAAHECRIKLHNRSVFAGQYQFDCTSDEWERISDWLGW